MKKYLLFGQFLNKKNDGNYAKDHSALPDNVGFVDRRQKPASVIAWAGVTSTVGLIILREILDQNMSFLGTKTSQVMFILG